MKNRKKYWKESVIWGKTIPNKEYNNILGSKFNKS